MQSGGAFFERELSARQESVARWAAVLVLLAVAAGLAGIGRCFQELKLSSGDIGPWMPVGTAERASYDRFSKLFETHDSLLISWDGAAAEDPRLLELSTLLVQRDRQRAKERQEPRLIAKVSSLPGLLDSFEPGLRSTPGFEARIRSAVAGYLTGKKGGPGVLVVEATEHGLNHRVDTFQLVQETAERVVRDAPGGLRYSGTCYMGVCANAETAKALRVVTPITALISLAVAFLFLRSLPLAMLCFASSGLAAALSVAIIHLSGRPLGEMLAVIPSLAQLTTMSSGVHLINYYLEYALHQKDYRRAWLYAVHSGWEPTVSAQITTAIGFGSLYASNFPVVKDFAVFGAIGVLSSVLIVLLVIPAVLILFRPRVVEPWRIQHRFVEGVIRMTFHRKWLVTGVLAMAFFAGIAGLSRLRPDVLMEGFFADGSPFRRDFDWFEQKLGPLQSSNVMITFPGRERDTTLSHQFDYLEALTERIRQADSQYAVFSPVLFREGVAARFREHEPVLEGVLDHAQDEGWAWTDAAGDHWRLALRHPSETDPVHSAVVRQIAGIARDLAAGGNAGEHPPVVEVTGIARLFGASQFGLLRQMLTSFFLAFLTVTPILVISLRSLKLGLIAILPNIFPLGIFFGALGWLDVGVDIATMMIASVVFGITVDDTVHFLTWMERGLAVEHSVSRAVSFALRNTGGAMVQTTLILSLGMMAFLLSDFKPSVRFASFSAVALLIALVGDLVLLPALLQGVFCRIFRRFHGESAALE